MAQSDTDFEFGLRNKKPQFATWLANWGNYIRFSGSRQIEIHDLVDRISLEHVEYEVVSPVISVVAWISVVPLTVVYGDLHLGRVTIVHAVAAAIVLVAPKVLWVIDVRIMVEPVVVATARGTTPLLSERLWLLCVARLAGHGPASQTA